MAQFAFLTTRNVGNFDRVIRALPALLTTWVWWQGALSGMELLVAALISAMLLLTTIMGSCSIYYMLGRSTCPRSGEPR